jgi:adhesin transport system membrane fusion protein
MNREEIQAMVTPRPVGRLTHLFFWLCVSSCLAFFLWAYYGRLDVVSRALGEVVPSTQVKHVQHLEGGVVYQLLVREGDRVAAGQELVILDAIASRADVDELQVRMDSLRLEILRLEAEAALAEELEIPGEFLRSRPAMVEHAKDLLRANRETYLAELEAQGETVAQREQEIREVKARIRNEQRNLRLIREQIRISRDLLKDDLTNRYTHLGLLREEGLLRGNLEEDQARLQRAGAALEEARSERQRITRAYQQKSQVRLERARRELEEHAQRMRKFKDSLRRSVLRSPVDGVVKTLFVHTRGGVVQPGATVVDIVPVGDRLIIEARLPVHDIGYVRQGQSALIRLASADGARFPPLDGVVEHISPDSFVDRSGAAFYKVTVSTGQDHFQSGSIRYQLYPGVQVMTSIRTGERSVLDYLLAPLSMTAGEALQER